MQIAVISVFATMAATAIGFWGVHAAGKKPAMLLGSGLLATGIVSHLTRRD